MSKQERVLVGRAIRLFLTDDGFDAAMRVLQRLLIADEKQQGRRRKPKAEGTL